MKLKVLPILVVFSLLAGCGVKPANLTPPDPKKNYFPRTYPDPALDPPAQNPERQVPK